MRFTMTLVGVNVVMERSWLITAVGITVGFGGFVAVWAPSTPLSLAFALGAAVALAVTASLVLHELAHARVAVKAGIGVEHIRVFAGGALCRRRVAFEHAGDQFRVAAAGPVASVTLGILALALAFALERFGFFSTASAALWFVAGANLLIAVSNLLPLFPYDGGKVMHALFWRETGDQAVATRRLRRSGREFARVVVALGVLTAAWAGDAVLGLAIAAFGLYLHNLPRPQ